MSLLASLSASSVLEFTFSAALSLSAALNQALGIIATQTISLLASISASSTAIYLLNAALSLSPTINQSLGIIIASAMSLFASLSTSAAYMAMLSATLSLSSTLNQALAITSTATISLLASLTTMITGQFHEAFNAFISIGPTLNSIYSCLQQTGSCGGSGLLNTPPPLFSIIGIIAIVFVLFMAIGIFRRRKEERYVREPYF